MYLTFFINTRSVSNGFTGIEQCTSSSVVIKMSHTKKANAATTIREKMSYRLIKSSKMDSLELRLTA